MNINDQQALAFAVGQAYKINQRVYETRYPDWDFSRLIFVDSSGPAWAPGIITYTSDVTGQAKWQSGYAKDIPLADVNQGMSTRTFSLAAIGYQWNLEEINIAMGFPGSSLPDRRARAARLAYMRFMYGLTLTGDAAKGLSGLINYGGVTVVDVAADGTGSARNWVNSAGTGLKTPAQIVRDINLGLQGVNLATSGVELADTILLPVEAFNYIAQTPYSATTTETILSFVQRTNIYTIQTGRPLTIRTVLELGRASTQTDGRMVAYKNDENYVKLHLPMPHQFLPVYQDGPLNFLVPGIFRTGGVEILSTAAVRYVDQISAPPA